MTCVCDVALLLLLRTCMPCVVSLLLSWLPVVGDPLCSLAGWLKMPFWPSLIYMAMGKFLRYLTATALLMLVPDGVWHRILPWF